jgi:hypothetical protein
MSATLASKNSDVAQAVKEQGLYCYYRDH